jgi:CHASE1-domain containing sensor protein
VLTRLATSRLEPAAALSEWLTWWSGDTLGVLLFAPLTLLVLGRRHAHEASHRIGSYRIAVPLLGAALLLGGGHLLLSKMQTREAQLELDNNVQRFNELYFAAVDEQLGKLESLAHMIQGRPDLTAQEFGRFAGWLTQSPALLSLDWAPKVTAEQRTGFERQSGRAMVQPVGMLNTRVRYVPAQARYEHFPVLYSVPPVLGETVLGLDHNWDLPRRQAIIRALQTGRLQLIKPAPLIRTDTHSMLAFQPVYAAAGEGGQTEPLGVIVGVFQIEQLFQPLLQQIIGRNLAGRIVDITDPERPQTLIDRTPPQSSIIR